MDVSKIDLTTDVLGFKIGMPIMVAPTALHKLAHPEGKLIIHPSIIDRSISFELHVSINAAPEPLLLNFVTTIKTCSFRPC